LPLLKFQPRTYSLTIVGEEQIRIDDGLSIVRLVSDQNILSCWVDEKCI